MPMGECGPGPGQLFSVDTCERGNPHAAVDAWLWGRRGWAVAHESSSETRLKYISISSSRSDYHAIFGRTGHRGRCTPAKILGDFLHILLEG